MAVTIRPHRPHDLAGFDRAPRGFGDAGDRPTGPSGGHRPDRFGRGGRPGRGRGRPPGGCGGGSHLGNDGLDRSAESPERPGPDHRIRPTARSDGSGALRARGPQDRRRGHVRARRSRSPGGTWLPGRRERGVPGAGDPTDRSRSDRSRRSRWDQYRPPSVGRVEGDGPGEGDHRTTGHPSAFGAGAGGATCRPAAQGRRAVRPARNRQDDVRQGDQLPVGMALHRDPAERAVGRQARTGGQGPGADPRSDPGAAGSRGVRGRGRGPGFDAPRPAEGESARHERVPGTSRGSGRRRTIFWCVRRTRSARSIRRS